MRQATNAEILDLLERRRGIITISEVLDRVSIDPGTWYCVRLDDVEDLSYSLPRPMCPASAIKEEATKRHLKVDVEVDRGGKNWHGWSIFIRHLP